MLFNMTFGSTGSSSEPTPTEVTISRYPASYTTSGSINGTNYQNAIGKGADTTTVSGYDRASSYSYPYIEYGFDFSAIPDDATITEMTLQVKGHRQSTSSSYNRARLQVYSGGSAKSGTYNITSTSTETATMDFTGYSLTVAELKSAVLRFTIGYRGGLVNGATWTVTYEA